jgi:hypothetical protein
MTRPLVFSSLSTGLRPSVAYQRRCVRGITTWATAWAALFDKRSKIGIRNGCNELNQRDVADPQDGLTPVRSTDK